MFINLKMVDFSLHKFTAKEKRSYAIFPKRLAKLIEIEKSKNE